MKLSNCRIHKGKLVRMFKGACEGNINCVTPDCLNNDQERMVCKLPSIEVNEAVCTNYALRSKYEHMQKQFEKKISIKRTAAEDIVLEVPESNAKDVKSPADKPAETLDEAVKDEAKDISSVKSQVWSDTLTKTVDEAIDVDGAAEEWFKNMKEELGKKLSADEISEADYDSLLTELEDMKETGVLADSIKSKILEQSEETPAEEGGEEKETLEDVAKEEPKKDEGEKKEEEPKEKKPAKKEKEKLPELPGLDLENV